jgi:TolB protein
MERRLLISAACLLVSVACTDGDTGESPVSDAPGPTTAPSGAAVSGRLVVIGADGNIVTLEPDGAGPVQVTEDAGEATRYAQPSWSPSSDRLAWVELSTDGIGVGLGDPAGGDRSLIEMTAPPFYLNWSPDGTAMAVLHNGSTGALELEMVDAVAGTSEVVAEGAPLYFSWSPAGDQIVAHIEEETLVGIGLDGVTRDLGPTATGYAAPTWITDGIVHLAPGGLALRAEGGAVSTLATVRPPVAMVANPDGTRIAVQSYADDESGISAALAAVPSLPANEVVVLDRATGEISQVTEGLSVGFFWSPDGEKLLVLQPSGPGEMEVLVWEEGETTPQFLMTPQPSFVRDVLQFFDQYAQSLRLWSPDSRAVALAGAVEGEAGVWVHQIGDPAPTRVLDGTWAAWSG